MSGENLRTGTEATAGTMNQGKVVLFHHFHRSKINNSLELKVVQT